MSSKGPEVHGDVKGLVEGSDHIAEHGLEGGVVGAVRHIQDGRHLPRRVRLHLLEQGLQVDALKGKSNHVLTTNSQLRVSNSFAPNPTFASQNLISVIGPGFNPLLRSSAESLLKTSSV